MKSLQKLILVLLIGYSVKVNGQDVIRLNIWISKGTFSDYKKEGDYYKKYKVVQNTICYRYDSLSKELIAKDYFIIKSTQVAYYEDNDSIRKTKLKGESRKKIQLTRKLSLTDFNDLLVQLKTDIDTLDKSINIPRVSVSATSISFQIWFKGANTIEFDKLSPFEYNSPWKDRGLNGGKWVLNPNIDKIIASLLPLNFFGRDNLLLTQP